LSTSSEANAREARLKIHGGLTVIIGPTDIFSPERGPGILMGAKRKKERERERERTRPKATGPGYSGSLNRFLGPVRWGGRAQRRHDDSPGPEKSEKEKNIERA